ncbi:DNA-binding response regulator [Sphingobacteriaceae bacterium]|nr:DNA-binding response regulator [Sphingobacteriaceae bacterium]
MLKNFTFTLESNQRAVSVDKKRIYIVDDHQIMIDGIKSLLAISNAFEVVGEQTNPLKAIEAIPEKKADILITDISMKEMSGIELARKMRVSMPDLKILALSMYSDRETISEMLVAGINGYVLKNTGMEELIAALTKISQGHQFFSEEVTAEMMKAFSQPKIDSKELVNLTNRELEIVKLIAEEYSNAQIGDKLFISERTVETHRKNIFRKTNTKSVAGLVKFAIGHNLI